MTGDLAQLTITSGHISKVARHEVGNGEMAMARAVLDRALTGSPAPLPAPWQAYAVAAEAFGASLQVTIFAIGPGMLTVEPLVIFGVAPRARSGRALWRRLLGYPAAAIAPDGLAEPPAPWCAALLMPALFDHRDIIPVLGDIEAAIAWAWLDRPQK